MMRKDALEIEKEGGTNSEREQLMRREVSLAFEISDRTDRWNDTLESLKSFIVIKGRMPNKRAADDEERRLEIG